MALKRLLPVLLLFTLYAAGMSAVNLVRYEEGGGDLDLGIVSQILWNTRHGNFLHTSITGVDGPIFREHFNPVYLPLTLLYYWREDPRLLLIVQSVVLGLALFPLWGLARGALGGPPAFLLCLAFAVNPVVHYINYFDFHPITIVVPTYLAVFYFLRRRFLRAAFSLLMFSLLIHEATSLILIGFGGYYWVHGPRRYAGRSVLLGLVFYLFLIFFFLTAFTPPGATPNYAYLQFFSYLPGQTGMARLISALTHPGLVLTQVLAAGSADYLGLLLLGFAGLPLLAPSLWLPMLPQLLFNLTSGFRETATIHLHYNAALIPFLAAATVESLVQLRRRIKLSGLDPALVGGWLVLAGALGGHLIDSPHAWVGTRRFHPDGLGDPRRFAQAVPLLQSIPAGASVGTEYKYWAYLGHRRDLFLFFDGHPAADYYLLDTRNTTVPPGFSLADHEFIAALRASGAYALLKENDGIVLLRRIPGH